MDRLYSQMYNAWTGPQCLRHPVPVPRMRSAKWHTQQLIVWRRRAADKSVKRHLATPLLTTNNIASDHDVLLAHLCHDGLIFHWVEGASGINHAPANLQHLCRVQRNAQLQGMQAIAILL